MKRRFLILASAVALSATRAAAAGSIELVYIGGRDCPWCRRWTSEEKPRLVASQMYRRLRYVEIETARMRDSYNPRYWPRHLQPVLRDLPLKDGTPRFLILRDGVLHSNELGGWDVVLDRLSALTRAA